MHIHSQRRLYNIWYGVIQHFIWGDKKTIQLFIFIFIIIVFKCGSDFCPILQRAILLCWLKNHFEEGTKTCRATIHNVIADIRQNSNLKSSSRPSTDTWMKNIYIFPLSIVRIRFKFIVSVEQQVQLLQQVSQRLHYKKYIIE